MTSSQALSYFSVQTLRQFHRVNAVVLFVFLIVHLITHLSGVFGIDAYNSVQDGLRKVYRHPLIEPVLLTAVALQMLAGVRLLVRSLRQGRPSDAWGWAQLISGGFFFIFIAQHLFSLGMARLYFDLDTNFYWPASVMSGPPFTYFFIPYYFFGVWAVLAHIGIGVRYLMLESGHTNWANRTAALFIVCGAAISALIVPIVSGAFFHIDLSQEWIDYLRFYVADFEPWN